MKSRLFWTIVQKYKWKSVFFNYFLIIFISILLSLSLIGGLLVYSYNERLLDNITAYYDNETNKIAHSFDTVLTLLNNNFSSMAANETVVKYLYTQNYENANEQARDVSLINSLFHSTLLNMPYTDSVYLYKPLSNYVLANINSNFLEYFPDRGWFDIYLQNDSSDYATFRKTDIFGTKYEYVTVCRNIYSDGVLVFNISTDELRDFLIGQNEFIKELIIADTEEKIIFSLNKDYTNNTIQQYDSSVASAADENHIISRNKTANYGYTVITENAMDIFQKQFRLASILLLSAFVASFIIALIISFYISRYFYKFVLKTIDIITNNSTVSPRMSTNLGNEFQFISSNILRIKSKITDMETDLTKGIASLKKAQIMALQEQINPHFIFNSMSLISMKDMSEHKKQTPISRITFLLSEILRGILDTKNYLVPFETELLYLEKYIELQNIKYMDMIKFTKHIEPETKNLSCIKFMLQPIIENSINHGILNKEDGTGEIELFATVKDGVFKIVIKDDGVGIPTETLQSIRMAIKSNEIPENKHIGIANAYQRIRLVYGEEYGLTINSDSNGTTVCFRLPVIDASCFSE